MELNYIRDFVILAEIGHFQKAAAVLFMEQPTLSKHIRAIEKELDHELFDRHSRPIELTEFGRQFYPYARQLMEVQMEYRTALLPDPKEEQALAIGYTPMITLYNFIQFYNAEYVQKDRRAGYSLIQGNTRNLLDLLERKNVDFILTENLPSSNKPLQRILYTSDRLMAVLPKGHPLALKEYVTIEDLAQETLITFSDLSDPAHYLNRLYPGTRFRPSITVEKETLLFDLIRKGLGISVITYRASVLYVSDDMEVREVRPEACVEIYMICRGDGCATRMGNAFAAYLKGRKDAV